MTTAIKKKPIQHIGSKQKEALKKGPLKLVFANYDEVESILSDFNIPKNEEKVLVIFSKSIPPQEESKEPSLKGQLEALGFTVPQNQEIEPVRFKTPVPLKSQKQVLLDIQKILGVTQEEIANMIGCSPRKIWSVLNAKDGAFKVKSHINNFNQLVSLVDQLLFLVKEKSIKGWLRNAQKVFNNKTPFDLLISGKIERLFQWAYVHLEGQYK